MDGRKTIRTTERYLSDAGYSLLRSNVLPAKCVAVSCIGWQMGKAVLTSRPSFTNQQINTIIPDRSRVDPDYLYYLLTTRREELKRLGSVGTRTPILNKNAFCALEVELPELTIQHRIASILSAYDDLIENNTRRIKILEEMAQMLYREWFVKFRFPGHAKVRMVESELGPVPEGWQVQPLPHLCSKVIDGTHDSPPPVKDGFFLVTGKHFTSGFIDFDSCYRISPDEHDKVMKRSKPEPGDILFSNIGTLGSIALVPADPKFSIKNVALFKPKTAALSTFLYCHFRLPESLEVLHQKASGTSQKFWSLQFLRNLPLLSPPEKVIALFHHQVEPLLSYRLLLNNKNTNLRTTRNLLLPKLISGEIPVEAATELMEQIA